MQADKQSFFKETQQLVEDYEKERILLLKLQTAEKTAQLASIIFGGVIIGVFVFFILLFLSIMAGYFLEELTGSWYYGLGIVTAFYAVLVAILIYFRKALLYKFISNSVIRILFEEIEPTDEEQKA